MSDQVLNRTETVSEADIGRSHLSRYQVLRKSLMTTMYLLGIKVDCDQPNRVPQLSQTQYILDMLKQFNMEDCYSVATPMDPGSGTRLTKYVPSAAGDAAMRNVPYMNAVRAPMYLAIGARPDIAYTVSKLAQLAGPDN